MGIEYAYKNTIAFRSPLENRDGAYPLCKRDDVKKWSKLILYPGAMLLLPLRLFMLISTLLWMLVLIYVISMCHNFKKGPLTGIRK